MKKADLTPLQQLARLHGVQISYADMEGKKQNASAEALIGVLGAFGVPTRTPREVRAAIEEHQQEQQRPGLEPVVVAWDGRNASVCVRIPTKHIDAPLRAEIRLENGESVTLKQPKRQRTAALQNLTDFRSGSNSRQRLGVRQSSAALARRRNSAEILVKLPNLPFGYHELYFQIADLNFRSLIISAPEQSYSNPELAGSWGLFAPLYAVHSKSTWGAGNFTDWRRLGDWTSSLGGKVLATLPLLATFLDYPFCEPGPYSPASRMFWNEFFVDIERIPEFKHCGKLVGAVHAQLCEFRQDPLIDYAKQWASRRRVLEQLSTSFFRHGTPARQKQFDQFLLERPDTRNYAQFRAICDQTRTPWPNWPERLRRGRINNGDAPNRLVQFHQYVQWIAQEQINEVIEHARTSGWTSYLDLPVGVNAASYDVWKNQSDFALGASVGAPPDPIFQRGQNWGFPPLHPRWMRENRYEYMRQFIRFQMRHSGILRIDHVMGLHRLYLIPQNAPASQGAYVSYCEDELYAMLCLESHRHQTVLAGENLGTVPPEVNKRMSRHGLRQTYVVQYALQPKPKKPLKPPPKKAVASLNTHDMPTFGGFIEGKDIDDRAALGLIPKNEVAREQRQRRKLVEALRAFLRRERRTSRDPHPEDLLHATLDWMAATSAEIVLITLEDLWLETKPQNVPSTSSERPNWRRKLALSIEEMQAKPGLRRLLSAINHVRNKHRTAFWDA